MLKNLMRPFRPPQPYLSPLYLSDYVLTTPVIDSHGQLRCRIECVDNICPYLCVSWNCCPI